MTPPLKPDCHDTDSAQGYGIPAMYAFSDEGGIGMTARILEAYKKPSANPKLKNYLILQADPKTPTKVIAYMERGYARSLLEHLAELIGEMALVGAAAEEAMDLAAAIWALPEEEEQV